MNEKGNVFQYQFEIHATDGQIVKFLISDMLRRGNWVKLIWNSPWTVVEGGIPIMTPNMATSTQNTETRNARTRFEHPYMAYRRV